MLTTTLFGMPSSDLYQSTPPLGMGYTRGATAWQSLGGLYSAQMPQPLTTTPAPNPLAYFKAALPDGPVKMLPRQPVMAPVLARNYSPLGIQ
jgi:hypothetical protein